MARRDGRRPHAAAAVAPVVLVFVPVTKNVAGGGLLGSHREGVVAVVDVTAAGVPARGAVGERDELEAAAAATAVESLLLLLRREQAAPARRRGDHRCARLGENKEKRRVFCAPETKQWTAQGKEKHKEGKEKKKGNV